MVLSSTKAARLVAELALLRKHQIESMENATFFGWTPEATADYEKSADRIALLVLQLAKFSD